MYVDAVWNVVASVRACIADAVWNVVASVRACTANAVKNLVASVRACTDRLSGILLHQSGHVPLMVSGVLLRQSDHLPSVWTLVALVRGLNSDLVGSRNTFLAFIAESVKGLTMLKVLSVTGPARITRKNNDL